MLIKLRIHESIMGLFYKQSSSFACLYTNFICHHLSRFLPSIYSITRHFTVYSLRNHLLYHTLHFSSSSFVPMNSHYLYFPNHVFLIISWTVIMSRYSPQHRCCHRHMLLFIYDHVIFRSLVLLKSCISYFLCSIVRTFLHLEVERLIVLYTLDKNIMQFPGNVVFCDGQHI